MSAHFTTGVKSPAAGSLFMMPKCLSSSSIELRSLPDTSMRLCTSKLTTVPSIGEASTQIPRT